MPRSAKKPLPIAGKNTPKTKATQSNKPANAAVSKSVVATQEFEEVIIACKKKVRKIAKECRAANRKFRDFHFDLSWDGRYCLDGLTDEKHDLNPAGTLRVEEVFENPKFYKDGMSAGDIEQGANGDCWFLAAVATISNVPGLLEKICVARDEAVGVYGFIFMRDGKWVSTIIDDQLYTTRPEYQNSDEIAKSGYHGTEKDYTRDFMRGSKALYFGKCHDPNETWLPLLEKAYAKAHGDFGAIEGGCPGEAVEDLTGGVTTDFLTGDLLDRNRFWKEEFLLVNKDFLFAASISGIENRLGILAGHSYSVLKAQEVKGEKFVLVRNPWGHSEWTGAWSDGSKEWTAEWMTLLGHRFGDDGAFWMTYNDFLHKFGHIEQTRLFDATWSVTNRWVKIPVPWAVEYSTTRFEVTVTHKGPVVLVLSQLDDRYFRGLQGQYGFEMHFRVYRDDEVDYIARSRSGFSTSRSVSIELELEPGKYKILFKVTAEKEADAKTLEQVTKETSKVDRDKFLQIAKSYDLAHDSIPVQPEDESEIKAAEASRAAKTVASKAAKGSGSGEGQGQWEGGENDEDAGSESGSSSSSSSGSSSSAPEAPNAAVSETTESVAGDEDDDVWDAIACVGLRVYSQNKDLTVAVVHANTIDYAQELIDQSEGEDEGGEGEGDDEKEGKKGKKGKKQDKKKGKKEKKKEDEGEDGDEKKDKKDKKDKKKDKKKGEGEDKDENEEEKVKDKKEKDKKDKKEEEEKDEKDEKKEKGEIDVVKVD